MIAPRQEQRPQILGHEHQAQFLEMLPRIRRIASRAFRRLHSEHREDLVQEVVANSYCAFVSLVRRERADTAYATPLANFAIRQAIAGRRVGTRSKLHDVASPVAHSAREILVERLDDPHGEWRAALVEDRRATPAQIAAARIDVAAWFDLLSDSHRRIAQALAMGETTSEVARQFGLSSARVSQIRGLLKASWEAFQGEAERCPA
jgi:RNA polymerase sigma factor (sigma-70 family)